METSSAVGSVALKVGATVAVRTIPTPREQTEQLLRLTDELLAEAGLTLRDLDGVAFGRGPGSFTGLRVAAAIAQGFAFATGVPLLPVSSLLCLAQGAWRAAGVERALVCVDAHMGEVYCGEFELRGDAIVPVGDERLVAPTSVVPPSGRAWHAVGNGFAAYADVLGTIAAEAEGITADALPSAEDLLPQAIRDLMAGRTVAPADALPTYLRGDSAWRRSS